MGGVATFLLAILYTFPLGVWDRFFITPADNLRALVVKLVDVDAEFFKTSQSLPIEQFTQLSLALRAKKTALIESDRKLIEKREGDLSAAETELLAYQSASTGITQLALKLYDSALEKAKNQKDAHYLIADIYRLKAPLLLDEGVGKVRDSFAKAIDAYTKVPYPMNANMAFPLSTAIWDWANFEATPIGSKACSYFLAQWAIETMYPVNPNLAGQWNQRFQVQRDADAKEQKAPSKQCTTSEVRFVDQVKLLGTPQPPMALPKGTAPYLSTPSSTIVR
jgi:hypothetical protein